MQSGNLNICRLSFCTSKGLMNHNLSMFECTPASCLAACKDDGCHRSCHTYTHCLYRRFYHAHRVNYRVSSTYCPSWRIDIQLDWIMTDRIKIQKGRHDCIRHFGIHFASNKQDSAFQQKRPQIYIFLCHMIVCFVFIRQRSISTMQFYGNNLLISNYLMNYCPIFDNKVKCLFVLTPCPVSGDHYNFFEAHAGKFMKG